MKWIKTLRFLLRISKMFNLPMSSLLRLSRLPIVQKLILFWTKKAAVSYPKKAGRQIGGFLAPSMMKKSLGTRKEPLWPYVSAAAAFISLPIIVQMGYRHGLIKEH